MNKKGKRKLHADNLREVVEFTTQALRVVVAEWERLSDRGEDSPAPDGQPRWTQKASRWSPQRIRALGATTTLEIAAEILGIGRSKGYELARDGEFPVEILRIGRRYIIPTAAILRLLGAPSDLQTDRADIVLEGEAAERAGQILQRRGKARPPHTGGVVTRL